MHYPLLDGVPGPPTITTRDLRTSLVVSIAITVVLLLVRLARRSNPQFVVNALIGIGIAALFASRTGEARDVFLPGILYNGVYAVVLIATILVKWPAIGFMVGALVDDVTGWRRDDAMRRLCSRLTWLLVAPCVLRVVVQAPLYLADQVTLLGTMKVFMGWPLQVASLLAMGWLLTRNRIPVQAEVAAE